MTRFNQQLSQGTAKLVLISSPMRQLALRLRQRREELGLRQQDLASRLRVSVQAVSKWERGENDPDIIHLPELAAILQTSTDWLLGVEGYAQRTPSLIAFFGVTSARARSVELSPAAFGAWVCAIALRSSEIVLGEGGEPVKCLGPGVLACFTGAQAAAACRRAISRGFSITEAPLKIGVAEGAVWRGHLGHPDHGHRDVLGDPVSVALALADWVSTDGRHALAWAQPRHESMTFDEIETNVRLPGLPTLSRVGVLKTPNTCSDGEPPHVMRR